ncbi:MAG TPA: nitrilase-related carbon-nitrogen hydrolase [Planctomycetota bacterium]|nr:nitrilase-related carbon-nitrogen hydrolase [Planctomycetota bacterium]
MESEEIKHKPAQPDKTLAGPPDIKPPQYDQAVKHTDNKTLNYLMVRSLYRTKWFRLILAALSGLLLMTSFPPLSYGLFGWIALVPLLIAIYTSPTQRTAGLCGIIAGLVFYSISLSFLIEVFDYIGFIFANLLSVYLAVFSVSVWLTASKIGLRRSFLLIPFFWTGIEFFRSESYQLKFSWLSLGYSQAPYLTLIQVCDIIGIYGLTFLIVTVNALLAWFFLKYIRTLKWRWAHPIIAVLILLAILVYGLTREPYQPKHQENTALKGIPAVVIQQGIGLDSLDIYLKSTAQVVDGSEETLVAWPEALLSDIIDNPIKRGKIEAFVKAKKIYLVFGTIERTSEQVRVNNYAVLMGPDGQLIGKYAKRVPVPFLEAVVIPGDKWGAFDTGLGRIGIFICYESGFTRISRWLVVNKEVEVFVAPTLEVAGWGGLSHKIHAAILPFRAIETRRAIVRPTALGISQIIHPSGRIEGELGYLASGAIRSEVPRNNRLTWYVQYGYFFPKFCLWIYSGFILIWILLSLINYFKEE